MNSKKDSQVIVGELCFPEESGVGEVMRCPGANDVQEVQQQAEHDAVRLLSRYLENVDAEALKKIKHVEVLLNYQLVPNLKLKISPLD